MCVFNAFWLKGSVSVIAELLDVIDVLYCKIVSQDVNYAEYASPDCLVESADK